ncbi:MAG: SpoIIE family protein phosphatase [Ignavibacteriales bacterium]|nr:MAG: SpoIIE family protein phosphatase [Ignavibacteriales bacterium]
MSEVDGLRVKRNLTALIDFSRIINSSLDLNFITNNVLLTCMGKFLATKGMIALSLDGKIVLKNYKGISEEVKDNFPDLVATDECIDSKGFRDYLFENGFFAVEKIHSSNECVGLVCLGEKLNKSSYTKDDLEFLRTILNISASAIQNSLVIDELKKVNRALDSRIQRLNALFELSKEFGLFSESTKVAKLLVYSVIGQFLISKFAVVLFDNEDIQLLESKFDNDALINSIKKYGFNKLSNSITKKEITSTYTELEKQNIEIIVPMQLQGQTKGLIILGNRIHKLEYTPSDIEFIYSVGSLAIISLENKRLFVEALDKQKLEEELEIARDIQRNLLPHSIPDFRSFDIAAMNLSSKQVGGDYYDIIPLDDKTFCVAIADVSGKGVPAALLMANIQAFLKIICRHGMNLDEATALINDLITENTSDGKFITFCWGILEEDKKTLNYVNAGHNPPLLIRNGKIQKLEKGGLILGVMKTFRPYETELIQLQPDDVIVMFTDGITEAMNKVGDEFSDERLEALVIKNTDKNAAEILYTIQQEVKNFATGALQSDDITLIVIKVNGETETKGISA